MNELYRDRRFPDTATTDDDELVSLRVALSVSGPRHLPSPLASRSPLFRRVLSRVYIRTEKEKPLALAAARAIKCPSRASKRACFVTDGAADNEGESNVRRRRLRRRRRTHVETFVHAYVRVYIIPPRRVGSRGRFSAKSLKAKAETRPLCALPSSSASLGQLRDSRSRELFMDGLFQRGEDGSEDGRARR